MGVGELLDHRFEGAAWAAPGRAEIEEDGDGGLQDLAFEALGSDDGDVLAHAGTGALPGRSYERDKIRSSCKKTPRQHLRHRSGREDRRELERADMDPIGALTDLIRQHRGELVHAARREGLAPEDAVECTQEALSTFLQLLQRGDAPALTAAWLPYVVTITKNAARNRRRRHHIARPHDGLEADDPASEEASAEELLARAEQHVRLRACVERLCGTQRSVVLLRMLEERAGEDVASELGITRGHVDVLLHRAKASLRECMAE